MMRKLLLAALIGASFASVPLASVAQVTVRIAPPPPREEAAPAPRRGMVWAPGHWEWRNRRHVWVGGHWIRERRGYAYNSPRWVERNGRWVMEQGRWTRGDRDGDGIRNRNDRDRDGDGVRNRNDAAPNNPNRN
jgi:hypothetical protein